MKLLKYILGLSILLPSISLAQVPVDFSQNINKYYNKSNGIAPLDGNGNIYSPSLNQTLTAPTINGGVETTFPTDKPGAAGTAIPNTFWVDSYYTPKSTFISSNTTWTVCASGCNYTNPLNAWNDAVHANIINNSTLTISISDGTYNIAGNFYTQTTETQHVHVIGDTADNSKVVLNFINTKGNNVSGFSAYDGGKIGLIDGVTITQASDGTGALASTDSSNRQIWNSQSYGAGIQAYGAGSQIRLGSHINVSYFYYSVVADNNGVVDAPSGGVTGEHAGDVNFMARGGGVIVCTPCTAAYASDYTDPSNTLGSNYDAERNGSLYIDGSTGSNSLVNGLVGITGGAIWAHNTKWTGGLNGGGNGVSLWSGSHAELDTCNITGYSNGADVTNASVGDFSGCTVTGMPVGLNIDGGTITGSNLVITNNTTGINVMHNGTGIFYNTWSNMTGNTTNYSVESAGTRSPSGTTYTASSLDLQ